MKRRSSWANGLFSVCFSCCGTIVLLTLWYCCQFLAQRHKRRLPYEASSRHQLPQFDPGSPWAPLADEHSSAVARVLEFPSLLLVTLDLDNGKFSESRRNYEGDWFCVSGIKTIFLCPGEFYKKSYGWREAAREHTTTTNLATFILEIFPICCSPAPSSPNVNLQHVWHIDFAPEWRQVHEPCVRKWRESGTMVIHHVMIATLDGSEAYMYWCSYSQLQARCSSAGHRWSWYGSCLLSQIMQHTATYLYFQRAISKKNDQQKDTLPMTHTAHNINVTRRFSIKFLITHSVLVVRSSGKVDLIILSWHVDVGLHYLHGPHKKQSGHLQMP